MYKIKKWFVNYERFIFILDGSSSMNNFTSHTKLLQNGNEQWMRIKTLHGTNVYESGWQRR